MAEPWSELGSEPALEPESEARPDPDVEPESEPSVSVRAEIAGAIKALEQAGIPSPTYDAEFLAGWVLGVSRMAVPFELSMSAHDVARYRAAVRRRAEREPLQHIVGSAPFRYIEVAVGPGVFVPRPETEVVAGFAIDQARHAGSRPVVVDLCTGSGAIALAIADEVADARVHAVEVSEPALAWVVRNVAAARPAVRSRVTVHGVDATSPSTLRELSGAVDVVVSNPPYIPPDAVIRDPEVATHDPAPALWGGGHDGLDVMRGVVSTAARLLRDGGWLVVEHADLQGEAVPALLRSQGCWEQISDHPDLAGRDRFAIARKRGTGRPDDAAESRT